MDKQSLAVGLVAGALVGGVGVHLLEVAATAPAAPAQQGAPDGGYIADAGGDQADSPWQPPDAAVARGWRYREIPDELRGSARTVACVSSGTATLCVRTGTRADSPDVFVSLLDDTVGCGFRGCQISARFDDGVVASWRANRGEGGRSVFVSDGGRFVRSLLRASSLVVEVDVYGRLPQQITFDVAGLEWTLPPPPRGPIPRCVDLLAEGRTGDCR
jgi:hypothetical protein